MSTLNGKGKASNGKQHGGKKSAVVKKPRLPPIPSPVFDKDDKYASSKLMTYRAADERQNLLTKIMLDNAHQVYDSTVDYNTKKEVAAISDEPEYPDQMMSRDRRVRLNYQFMKNCVESAPVVPIQSEWFDNILHLIPDHLKTPKNREVIQGTFEEVRENFAKSMKKSLVQHALVKPAVKGLDADDWAALADEPTGLDYSRPWHGDYVEAQERIRSNLHTLHPSMLSVLQVCQGALGEVLIVDCSHYRAEGPLEFSSLKNNITLECEKSEDKLMHTWYPQVINIFADKSNFTSVRHDKLESFYNCVTALISNQVVGVLSRTIEAWVSLFDENNKENLPILKMQLTFDDRKMQFYPPYEDLEELALFVVNQICKTMQSITTVYSWLSGGNHPDYTPAAVANHVVDAAKSKLIEAVQRNFEEPKVHLQEFGTRYKHSCLAV